MGGRQSVVEDSGGEVCLRLTQEGGGDPHTKPCQYYENCWKLKNNAGLERGEEVRQD